MKDYVPLKNIAELLHPLALRARLNRMHPPTRGGWVEAPRHHDSSELAHLTPLDGPRVRVLEKEPARA